MLRWSVGKECSTISLQKPAQDASTTANNAAHFSTATNASVALSTTTNPNNAKPAPPIAQNPSIPPHAPSANSPPNLTTTGNAFPANYQNSSTQNSGYVLIAHRIAKSVRISQNAYSVESRLSKRMGNVLCVRMGLFLILTHKNAKNALLIAGFVRIEIPVKVANTMFSIKLKKHVPVSQINTWKTNSAKPAPNTAPTVKMGNNARHAIVRIFSKMGCVNNHARKEISLKKI